MEEHSIFDGMSPQLARASSGKRFLNYLLDLILFIITLIIFQLVLYALSGQEPNDSDTEGPLFNILFSILFALFVGFQEALLNGKTISKFITNTKTVNLDGSDISFGTAIKRGFCKIVPFNQLSALGTPCIPWHDKWNDTMVIDLKSSKYFNEV